MVIADSRVVCNKQLIKSIKSMYVKMSGMVSLPDTGL